MKCLSCVGQVNNYEIITISVPLCQ